MPFGASPEFTANTEIQAEQSQPGIAALSRGGFVIVWKDVFAESVAPTAAQGDIKAQRFDASGARSGPETVVNTMVNNGRQEHPVVAEFSPRPYIFSDLRQFSHPMVVAQNEWKYDRLVVAWEDWSKTTGSCGHACATDIRAATFNPPGPIIRPAYFDLRNRRIIPERQIAGGGLVEKARDFLVNVPRQMNHEDPAVSATGGGNYVIAWTNFGGLGTDPNAAVGARVLDSDQDSSPIFRVNDDGNASKVQAEPTIALGPLGLFYAWVDYEQGANQGINFTEGVNGLFQSLPTDVKHYSGLNAEFFVNSAFPNHQWKPNVASIGDKFVTVFIDDSAVVNESHVRARIIERLGPSPASPDFLVSSSGVPDNPQDSGPKVAELRDQTGYRGFVVVWQQTGGPPGNPDRRLAGRSQVIARVYDSNAVPGAEFLVNNSDQNNHSSPVVAGLGDGRFVVAWEEQGDIKFRIYSP